MKYFGDIRKPDMSKLEAPVTKIASLHLRKKIEWFSNQKEQKTIIQK